MWSAWSSRRRPGGYLAPPAWGTPCPCAAPRSLPGARWSARPGSGSGPKPGWWHLPLQQGTGWVNRRNRKAGQTFAKGHLRDAKEGRTGFTSKARFRRTLRHHSTPLDFSFEKNKCHDKHCLPLIPSWGCSWTTVQNGYGNCESHWKLALKKVSYETTGKEDQPTLSQSTHRQHFSGGFLVPRAFPAFVFIISKCYSWKNKNPELSSSLKPKY